MNKGMDLAMSVEKSLSTVYTEHPSELHTAITEEMIEGLSKRFDNGVNTILDVGCGMGVAWPTFRKVWPDCLITVVTPDKLEKSNAIEAGLAWEGRILSDVTDDKGTGYDLIWARHSLEHSTSPFLDLLLIKGLLSPTGWFYMEVPAPGTACKHECNPNHFSVMGKLMWLSLLDKVGLEIADAGDIGINLEIGEDCYHWFLCRLKS